MIDIHPFSSPYRQGVIDLILPIQQQEFEIPVSLDDQPDLQMVEDFYQRGHGNFWVAIADGRVVGTIGLLDIGGGQAALRKMFVEADHRGSRHGIAKRLVETLTAWCRGRNLERVFLGTTAQFLAAHRFYEKNGFRELPRERLPESFPVMQVDSKFYVLDL